METLNRINAAASAAVKAARKAVIAAKGAIIGPTDQLYTLVEVPGGYALNRKRPRRYHLPGLEDISEEVFSTPEEALTQLAVHIHWYNGAYLADPGYDYMERLHVPEDDEVSSSFAHIRQMTGLSFAIHKRGMSNTITWKPKE